MSGLGKRSIRKLCIIRREGIALPFLPFLKIDYSPHKETIIKFYPLDTELRPARVNVHTLYGRGGKRGRGVDGGGESLD